MRRAKLIVAIVNFRSEDLSCYREWESTGFVKSILIPTSVNNDSPTALSARIMSLAIASNHQYSSVNTSAFTLGSKGEMMLLPAAAITSTVCEPGGRFAKKL